MTISMCLHFQLMPLMAKDKVYMKISTHSWFEVDLNTMYLIVIKLDDTLQLPDGSTGKG